MNQHLADLGPFFSALAQNGRAPLADWPRDEPLEPFGLRIDGAWVVPAGRHDPLTDAAIREALGRRAAEWLQTLSILPVVGSTNAELMARAQQASVDGVVYTAELQVQGRGRRGRSWSSPFGANLAISLGVAMAVTPARLGGVSLVVGLAVVEALEQLQVPGLALKWPNDVLLGGDKLGGILIEMTQARGGTELVVGIGLNVALPETVRAVLPPGIADLAGAGVTAPRSVVAARVISAVVEFVEEFARQGFEPFLAPFNARHAFHGQECTVLMGERRVAGSVAGVTQSGELILRTADGPRTFHGGEVSLRQSL